MSEMSQPLMSHVLCGKYLNIKLMWVFVFREMVVFMDVQAYQEEKVNRYRMTYICSRKIGINLYIICQCVLL